MTGTDVGAGDTTAGSAFAVPGTHPSVAEGGRAGGAPMSEGPGAPGERDTPPGPDASGGHGSPAAGPPTGSGPPSGGSRGGDGDGDAPGAGEGGPHLSVDEPLLAARAHRPSDLIRFLAGVLGVAAVLVIAGIAQQTTSGLESDISSGATRIPGLITSFAGFVSSVAVLIVPLAFAVERLIKRDGLRVADGVLAAVLAHGVSLVIDLWVARGSDEYIRDALTRLPPGGTTLTDPVHGYLAPVIAYMTAVGLASRPRWRVALWVVVALDGTAELVGGYTTPLSLLLTVLLGLTVAYGTLYAIGSPNVRPTGKHLLIGLGRVGFAPIGAHRAPDAPGGIRRYSVVQADGPPLDIHVIDREQQASGFFYRLWRRLRLRSVAVRTSPRSLRQALEQEALIAYAAASSGARTPRLVATSDLGPDAVVLVYEHIEGRTLDELPDDEISDGMLTDLWTSVRALHDRRIAHRRLTDDALLITAERSGYLVNLAGGDIAAGELALRMDIAQLLATFALRVGPERAVATAAHILGPSRVADALPLLQPVGLSRSTRLALRQAAKERRAAAQAEAERQIAAGEKTQAEAEEELARSTEDLLGRIRAQVLQREPQAPVEPVKLERLRPKTLITFIAGAFALYFLLSQFTTADPLTRIATAHWGWVSVAVAAAALSYVAATLSLIGFVPERLSFPRAFVAQVAGSFVKLVAPAAVGGVALNTRFLQKAGIRPVLAVASVGASQLAGLGCHLLLLLTFGYIAGTTTAPDVASPRAVIAGLLTLAVLVLVVAAIAPLRRWLTAKLRSLLAGVVPRMLDLAQRPSKLATGFGGILLLTVSFVACLDACVYAFDGTASFPAVAVVFLTANAVGSAVPTPGGIGAVDLLLTGALTGIAGVPGYIAASAVILFRLLTLWLPVIPGWLSFTALQRRGAL